MKFTPRNIPKFQMGGAMEQAPVELMPAEEPMAANEEMAPAGPLEGQDPLMMIAQAAALALLTQDCLMAMQVCLAFLQLIQQALGGAPEDTGTPVFAKGGVLKRRVKK